MHDFASESQQQILVLKFTNYVQLFQYFEYKEKRFVLVTFNRNFNESGFFVGYSQFCTGFARFVESLCTLYILIIGGTYLTNETISVVGLLNHWQLLYQIYNPYINYTSRRKNKTQEHCYCELLLDSCALPLKMLKWP